MSIWTIVASVCGAGSSNDFVVSGSTTDDFKSYVKQESGKYSRLVKAANIKLEN